MEHRVETKTTAYKATSSDGAGRHHAESATALLSDEHRVIERVLAVLEELTRRPVAESLDNWQKALDFFRGFADGCHHSKEEKILFPALEEHGIPVVGGPLGMMLMEHEEGRGYVKSMFAGLADADRNRAAQALIDNAQSYVRLLRSHIDKEDEILFPMAGAVVSDDEQRQLLKLFEEQEYQESGAGTHEKYLKLVEELESSM